MDNWPNYVSKPELPEGYEFVQLAKAKGLKNEHGQHPWWIRVSWSFPHKAHGTCSRHVKIHPEFFESPIDAIDAAVRAVESHRTKRSLK